MKRRVVITGLGLLSPVGNDVDVEGQHLPPWDRGIRVALTSGGSADALARFDFLNITPGSQ